MEGVLFLIVPGLSIIDFLCFLVTGKRLVGTWWRVFDFLIMVVGPMVFLLMGSMEVNSCCGNSAFFSPEHRLSVYTIIGLCEIAFFYCSLRKKIAPPLLEVLVNCILLTGIVLNVFMIFHQKWWMPAVFGDVPVMIALIFQLIGNHTLLMKGASGREASGRAGTICLYLLRLPPLAKFPILLVLCLPVLVCIAAVLLIFGQKPDSLVQAFTQTYKHGLSQINSDCNGVVCNEGHFLCTIAAKGDPKIVKPLRAGVRGGEPIKCNRQLLVSNAFEEWLEDHLPAVHRPIRRLYNHVGNFIHRYYGAFDREWVSNIVYVFMKPLEWLFLLVLYMGDRAPETRIAQQYMSREDRAKLRLARTASIV